jgi:histidinol-phosphate aminotransferase
MSKFWSDIVGRLDPYVPGEQPQDQQYIKLNTNESPYPPSHAVAEVLADFDCASLRRYPDPESGRLVTALAEYHGLSAQQVFVGNGSDEVLAHAFQGLLQKPLPILFPDISYSFYPVYCALYQIEFETIALDSGFNIDINDYQRGNGGIVIPNPNAPTGIALDLGAIEQLLDSNPESVVIIDEAYVDFGARSAIALIGIEALQRVKNSFNSYPVDSLASACAIASLGDEPYFEQCRQQIIASRERLSVALAILGFEVFPSSSNFVFVRHTSEPAASLYQQLKKAGILVRYFNQPRIDNCLRITVGSDAECDSLLAALEQIIG